MATVVAPEGETKLRASVHGAEIEVRFYTRKVDIGPPSQERPSEIRNNCTYSRIPCSLLEGLTILVNKSKIVISRSAFGDLSDVDTAVISSEHNKNVLILQCGDASESTIVKIWFDNISVLRRDVYSAMDDASPIEQSVYHYLTLE
jgi:hypothetical protein